MSLFGVVLADCAAAWSSVGAEGVCGYPDAVRS